MWEFVAKKVCKLGSKTWIWILIWPAVKRHVQKWPFESQNGFSYLTKTFWTMQWKAIQVYSEGFLSTLVALEPLYISLFVRQMSFVSKRNIWGKQNKYLQCAYTVQLQWLNQTSAWMTQPNYSSKNLMNNLQRFGQTSASNRCLKQASTSSWQNFKASKSTGLVWQHQHCSMIGHGSDENGE